ncbi:hypothetical protein, partial [Mobiluncus curtisii]|uniref:hypothetical protein n=1 Tax=Mobiluncus curtisii TaxID=2051 RepID=UPI0021E1D2E7
TPSTSFCNEHCGNNHVLSIYPLTQPLLGLSNILCVFISGFCPELQQKIGFGKLFWFRGAGDGGFLRRSG